MHWISVKDRLPKPYTDVLALAEEGPVIAQYYEEGIALENEIIWTTSMNKTTDHVTHWMPLPTPPEKTDEKY